MPNNQPNTVKSTDTPASGKAALEQQAIHGTRDTGGDLYSSQTNHIPVLPGNVGGAKVEPRVAQVLNEMLKEGRGFHAFIRVSNVMLRIHSLQIEGDWFRCDVGDAFTMVFIRWDAPITLFLGERLFIE